MLATKLKDLGRCEFLILEHGRKRPVEVEDFDGHFYLGSIQILRCSGNASLVGSERMFKSNRLISCAPYWVWTHPHLMYKAEGDLLECWGDATPLCVPLRRAPTLAVDYLMHELGMPEVLEQQARSLLQTASMQRQAELLQAVGGQPLYELSDWWRLRPLVFVASYLGHVSKLRNAERWSTTRLEAVAQLLRTEPWTLVWGPDKPRLRADGYYRAVRDHALQPGLAVQVAIKIYFDALDRQREQHKHTLFLRSHYHTNFPCLPREERAALEEAVYALLMAHAMCWVVPNESFALASDMRDATTTLAALEGIARNAREEPEPECREGKGVPAVFGYDQLTRAQQCIFDSAQQHWLTVISGGPGTGKTALGTALCSHWRYVLQVGFAGMLVKMIRRRNGKRRECAFTIDYLLTLAKYGDPELVPVWLGKFQVLVIEEISNVNMERFAAVLALFPNVRKLICVGDYEQLKPIEAGDPMGDLLTAYPGRVFRLTENLRVQPALAALQEASPAISAAHPERIRWSAKGPISLVVTDDLYPILSAVHALAGRYALSHCHIITLQNHKADGRFALNKAAEEAWIRLGLLRPPQRRYVPPHIYPGAKISIAKNYNHPIDVGKKGSPDHWQSDPVVNGDLLIVRSVEKLAGRNGGLRVLVTDSEDPADDPEQRTLWIRSNGGVEPKHVVPGYASTAFKTQGGEFRYVIFWIDRKPGDQWTRPTAYVATSRARQRLWVVGEQREFDIICKRPEPRRRTVLSQLLDRMPDAMQPLSHFTPTSPTPAGEQRLALGAAPVVPTLASVAAEQRKKKGDDE